MNFAAKTAGTALVIGALAAGPWHAAEAQPADQRQPGQQQGQQARQPQQRQAQPEGTWLEDRVFVRLAERAYAGADFQIREDQGTVTISGTVPSDEHRQRVLRTVRRTPGVEEVRDQLRVDPGVARERAPAPAVPDDELERRVAHAIADAIPGARAGESWWFRGWRVEGPDNIWNFDVDIDRGDVTLEGQVPRDQVIRRAVEAALDVQGVRSVQSNLELDPRFTGWYGYRGHPPATYPYAAYPRAGWYGAAMPGRFHVVTGEVTRVDLQQGRLSLRTRRGEMDLLFPPGALRGLQQGDHVTVDMALRETMAPAASPRTGGQDRETGGETRGTGGASPGASTTR